MTFSRQ